MNKIHITMNNKFFTYILSALLFVFPIHLLFIFLKNLLYDLKIFKTRKVDAKVVSIGNIALGGTGKTPTTIAIANFLEKKGYAVGIVTRGHGRENISNSFLLKNHGWKECGDEVILLKNNTSSNTHIFVSLDKIYAAEQLSKMGCDIVLLDDGFQHRRIHRDIDIVLLGPENQNKKWQLIYPYGLLREPYCYLRRADITISTKSNLIKSTNRRSDYALSLEIKKEMIERDEFDEGPRKVFNYGHTFGHALEGITNYQIPHGIAVSYGMDMANKVSVYLGLLEENIALESRKLLSQVWGNTVFPKIGTKEYLNLLSKDKKNVGSKLNLILTSGWGNMFMQEVIPDEGFSELVNEILNFYYSNNN